MAVIMLKVNKPTMSSISAVSTNRYVEAEKMFVFVGNRNQNGKFVIMFYNEK